MFVSFQRHNSSTHSSSCSICWYKNWTHYIQSVLTTVHTHTVSFPTMLFLQLSGNRFSQEEVGVFFPAQHAVHFERVGWRAWEGHHLLAKFLERTLCHQLHPHWSNAAFDTEGLVDSWVLLETNVQLERGKDKKTDFTIKCKHAVCWWCLPGLSYLVSLFLCEVPHTFQLYKDLVMRIWATYRISCNIVERYKSLLCKLDLTNHKKKSSYTYIRFQILLSLRFFTQDAALCTAVVNQLSSGPLRNSFLQSIKEQRLRHFLPSNIQHLTPSGRRSRTKILCYSMSYISNIHKDRWNVIQHMHT